MISNLIYLRSCPCRLPTVSWISRKNCVPLPRRLVQFLQRLHHLQEPIILPLHERGILELPQYVHRRLA